MSYELTDINTDNLTAKFHHYELKNAIMQFKLEDDGVARAVSIAYDREEVKPGVKLTIETASNGYIIKTGGTVQIAKHQFEVDNIVSKETHHFVEHNVSIDDEEVSFLEFDNMEDVKFQMNVAAQAVA